MGICFRLHKNNTVTKHNYILFVETSRFRLHKNNTVTKLANAHIHIALVLDYIRIIQ